MAGDIQERIVLWATGAAPYRGKEACVCTVDDFWSCSELLWCRVWWIQLLNLRVVWKVSEKRGEEKS